MTGFLFLNLTGLLLISGCMVMVWWAASRINNAGIVDIFWSLLVLLAALYFTVMAGGSGIRSFALLLVIMVWALRLSFYIFYRTIRTPHEDARYRELKERWGAQAGSKMLKFYLQQGAGALLFAWPALFVARDTGSGLGFFQITGLLVTAVAVTGETFADLQLEHFKADGDNCGKVCREGLWNYSRHPNYFCEWLVWVGLAFYAFGSAHGWLTLICPVSMYYFLNHKTGVPLAEKQSLKSRGEAYAIYQNEVSAFFPRFPKGSR